MEIALGEWRLRTDPAENARDKVPYLRGCQSCRKVCPSGCILDTAPRVIDREHCIRCGNCFRACPVGAVERLD